MKSQQIIVANLGLLRAYRVIQGVDDRQPHLEMIEEWQPEGAQEKLSEQVTDKAGRFPKGSGSDNVSGDLSAGERHDLELEQRRRQVKGLADRITSILTRSDVASAMIAAGAAIHDQLLNALDATARAKIERTLALDLTKAAPADVLTRFQDSN